MPSKAELLCVDPRRVAEIWPHARRLVQSAALRAGLSDFLEIERDVLSGRSLLWLAWESEIEAIATTELTVANGRKSCTIVTCAGAGDWPDLVVGIEKYAKDEGCKSLRIYGRKGWLRVLDGYREVATVIEKAF